MTNYEKSDGGHSFIETGAVYDALSIVLTTAKLKDTGRGIPLTKLLIQYQSKEEGLLRASQMEVIERYKLHQVM